MCGKLHTKLGFWSPNTYSWFCHWSGTSLPFSVCLLTSLSNQKQSCFNWVLLDLAYKYRKSLIFDLQRLTVMPVLIMWCSHYLANSKDPVLRFASKLVSWGTSWRISDLHQYTACVASFFSLNATKHFSFKYWHNSFL